MSLVAGMMNLRSPNFITMTTDAKGDIGYISNPNAPPKPVKVKATLATIPVGTESLQKVSPTTTGSSGSSHGEWYTVFCYHFYLVEIGFALRMNKI